METEKLIVALPALPLLLAGVSLLVGTARRQMLFCAAGTASVSLLSFSLSLYVFYGGPLSAMGGWLLLDALSAFHLVVMSAVFALASAYGAFYFGAEIKAGLFTDAAARRYGGLWFGSMAAMILVLVSNNLGVMWVGIEATTLLTAFLICIHPSKGALEAMWKYLLMCSVGVALAFIGILLVAASTGAAGMHGTDAMLWTKLCKNASKLSPTLLKAGFMFLVIGYGTKAGLAPMHNWLPDAHSQAPSPVSAIFSGFMLNAALYCVLRCIPLAEAATGGAGWARGILVAFGLLSMLVAAAFIAAQHDIKRLLAYSSVEHMGVIAFGVGIGGPGAFAALFHVLNHSVCKSLCFFCAGAVGRIFGTHDIRAIRNVLRISQPWGMGMAGGLLALIGLAPFALFLSEFLIVKAALEKGMFFSASVFLLGLAVVFIGVLRNIITMAWEPATVSTEAARSDVCEYLLVYLPLAALLALGLWMPEFFQDWISQAALLLGGAG